MYSKHDRVKLIDTNFPVGTFIIDDHVVTIVTDEKVTAFDTKSSQNAEKYRKFFLSVWSG